MASDHSCRRTVPLPRHLTPACFHTSSLDRRTSHRSTRREGPPLQRVTAFPPPPIGMISTTGPIAAATVGAHRLHLPRHAHLRDQIITTTRLMQAIASSPRPSPRLLLPSSPTLPQPLYNPRTSTLWTQALPIQVRTNQASQSSSLPWSSFRTSTASVKPLTSGV